MLMLMYRGLSLWIVNLFQEDDGICSTEPGGSDPDIPAYMNVAEVKSRNELSKVCKQVGD